MAAANFDACLEMILRFEGGYSDNPADPGGSTNMGITQATLARARGRPVAKADVMALSRREAGDIYRSLYWNMVAGDALPGGVDLATFDLAVHSSPNRAIRTLRDALGLVPDGGMDAAVLAAAAKADAAGLARAISQRRQTFLQHLVTFATFGRGWSKRVEAIKIAALALAAGATHGAPPQGGAHNLPHAGTRLKGFSMVMTPTIDTSDFKPFWASQTIWSSVAVIGSSIAGSVLAWKSGDMAAFGAALTAAFGGMTAIAGRFRATTVIH